MGVDAAGLGLMTLARAGGADFRRVATIGRQSLEVGADEIAAFFRARGRPDLAATWQEGSAEKYCEGLLKSAFGAKEVQSFDASDYEQATIVHDMNRPLATPARFPVVLDFGTLEHVFNVAVAFDNVAALCAEGGHILHVLPGNNLAGHGFYQFSPEFFFQVYAQERGYAGTRVFAVVAGDSEHWYEIRSPREARGRVNLTSKRPFYLLVLTKKENEATPLAQQPVQQSDYVELWREKQAASVNAKRSPIEAAVRKAFSGFRHERKAARLDVTRARADVTRQRVLSLTPTF